MSLYVGQDGKLYYNSATAASPTWVEVKLVGDVSMPDLGINLAPVDLRISNWMLNLPAKLKGAIEFSIAHDAANTAFAAIKTMSTARTTKQFAVANGAIATAGTEYFKAFCCVENFSLSQPTQEMSAFDTRLALAYVEESSALVEPAWATTP